MKVKIEKYAFMIMPFNDSQAERVYRFCTKPICKKFSFTLRRADELFTNNPIVEDIIKEIKKDNIIIVDISNKNPNVFYELGISHAIKRKKTIIITRDEFNSIPFDIKHLRIIQYVDNIEGRKQFRNKLKKTLNEIFSNQNTMNKQKLIKEIASNTGFKEKNAEKFLDAFEESIKGALKRGEKIALIGFGTFATRERAKRNGVNPRTGKRIKILAKTVPYFKVGKELKESIK